MIFRWLVQIHKKWETGNWKPRQKKIYCQKPIQLFKPLFIYLFAREGEGELQWEQERRNLPPAGLLPKCPQQPELRGVKPVTSKSAWIFHMGGGDPTTKLSDHRYLPECATARSWHQKGRQHSNVGTPAWDVGAQAAFPPLHQMAPSTRNSFLHPINRSARNCKTPFWFIILFWFYFADLIELSQTMYNANHF